MSKFLLTALQDRLGSWFRIFDDANFSVRETILQLIKIEESDDDQDEPGTLYATFSNGVEFRIELRQVR